MKGNAEVLKIFNTILCNELTALNQFFLHARILENWGVNKLGKKEYDASIDEMKHADELIKRILFLEGIPNLQKLNKINIGQNVEEIIKSDLALEVEGVKDLREAVEICEKVKDYVSRDMFRRILDSEEEHVDWLETQLELIDRVGLERYTQSAMSIE